VCMHGEGQGAGKPVGAGWPYQPMP
jgi:hypothetical protein